MLSSKFPKSVFDVTGENQVGEYVTGCYKKYAKVCEMSIACVA